MPVAQSNVLNRHFSLQHARSYFWALSCILLSGFLLSGFFMMSAQAAETTKPAIAEPVLEPILDLPVNRSSEATLSAPVIPKSAEGVESNESSEDATGREPLKARAVLVDINSQTLNYDKEKEVYVATGSAHVVISEQNSELTADKVTYDQNSGMLIAEGHVVIIKNGQKTLGTYAKIDLNRSSALINDPVTTVKAIRIKAQKSFVSNNYIELEDGKFIISGQGMNELNKTGGLGNASNATGKGAAQNRLKREYFKKIRDQRAMFAPLDPVALALHQQRGPTEYNFQDDKNSVSRFSLKAKEIEVRRTEDGIDDVSLKSPSLYLGKYRIGMMPENEFAFDNGSKQYTYLGPDIGSQRNLGGAYIGPGWDFKLGRGFVRFSPVASLGNPGFVANNGKDGKDKGFGPGLGAMMHYRDADTTLDLSYNTRVGAPVGFLDRKLFGSDNTHLMASVNDFYTNGLIGQTERPNYIAQVTDYRVLKEFNNFMLTSFESVGWARDNFFPTNRENYFVSPTSDDPLSAGRVQLQAQIQNIKPLLQAGSHVNFGLRGQVAGSAYSSGDFLGILRGGPTMNVNFKKFRTSVGYFQTVTAGQSPFVFDAYIGGAQNLSLDNTFFINKYLILGTHQSLNLRRDNARNALAVGNSIYMLVGPQDIKMQLGYDIVNQRSSFGLQYYPGGKNTVVNFDKLKIYQPQSYGLDKPTPASEQGAKSALTKKIFKSKSANKTDKAKNNPAPESPESPVTPVSPVSSGAPEKTAAQNDG
jgi:hypothetical protein